MEYHAPRTSPVPAFEGYYNKFLLPSGAHLIVVISKVFKAERNGNALTFTYIPASCTDGKREIWQKLYFVEEMTLQHFRPKLSTFISTSTSDSEPQTQPQQRHGSEGGSEGQGHAFLLSCPGYGSVHYSSSGSADFAFETPEITFRATTTSTSTVPWPATPNLTPEGMLVHLPLPLHWHVHSLASRAEFSLEIPGYVGGDGVPAVDAKGEAVVHQEKNWATSFPSAHIWVHGRKNGSSTPGSSASASDFAAIAPPAPEPDSDGYKKEEGETILNLAGGSILGLKAFLIGYTSPDLELAFRPPLATQLPGGIGPFLSYTVDWEARTFDLSVQNFRHKLVLQASAPKGSFYPLAAPFPEGHRENFLNQSMAASLTLKIYENSSFGLGTWKLLREERFENAGLEFGADWFPPAGSESAFN